MEERDPTVRPAIDEALDSAVALARASGRLNRAASERGVADAVCEAGSALRGVVMGWIGLLDPASREVRPAGSWGAVDGYLDNLRIHLDETSVLSRGPVGTAIRQGVPVVMNREDPRFEPWRAEAERRGFQDVAGFPLKRPDGQVFGGLALFSLQAGYFDAFHVALFSAFADAASIAFENAVLHQQLASYAAGLEAQVASRTAQLERANAELSERTDRASEGSRLKSEFLASMSHELRSPLTAILGFSEVLRDELYGTLNPRQKEHITHIWESGRRLLDLIEEILDLSRIEAGQTGLELTEAYPRLALEAASILLHQTAFTHGVRIEWEVAPEADRPVLADERKLKQILFHLLSSAVRLSTSGSMVRARVELSDGVLVFRVVDGGPGVVPEDRDKLFREFTKVALRGGRARQGTGVGLPLARKLVEMHGGTLAVDEAVDGADAFVVRIPVATPR